MARAFQTFTKTERWGKVTESTAYTDDGKVWRWPENNAVVPPDVCREYGIPCGAEHLAARDAEIAAFVAEYRRRQPAEPSAEERAEARAAHGAGVELVDVVTGRRFTT